MAQMSARRTRKRTQPLVKCAIKRGDTVMVITGKDKGKTGIVKRVFLDRAKVLVEGLNMVRKAVKPNPMVGLQGGIVAMEAPLHLSNVMVYDLKTAKPTRVRREAVSTPQGQAKRVRVSKQSGEQLDD